jgi:integrase
VCRGGRGATCFSIVEGRNAGYAPATINRRLAAVSGLFGFRQLRDPDAVNPVPRGREARAAARGERTGLLAHVNTRPKNRSRLRVREPRRLPRGLDRVEATALLGSLRTWRDRAIAGLMLYSGLRSAEVLGLAVRDVDVGRRWVRVVGKGDKERRVPLDAEVAGTIQTYLLVERPETEVDALFVVAKGATRGQRLTSAGLRTVFRYHRELTGVAAGHPHALRHSFDTALEVSGVASCASFGKIRERPLPGPRRSNWIRVGWWRPRHTHPDQAIDATVALNAMMWQPIRRHPAPDSGIGCN